MIAAPRPRFIRHDHVAGHQSGLRARLLLVEGARDRGAHLFFPLARAALGAPFPRFRLSTLLLLAHAAYPLALSIGEVGDAPFAVEIPDALGRFLQLGYDLAQILAGVEQPEDSGGELAIAQPALGLGRCVVGEGVNLSEGEVVD